MAFFADRNPPPARAVLCFDTDKDAFAAVGTVISGGGKECSSMISTDGSLAKYFNQLFQIPRYISSLRGKG
jgi:hypothetical protein